MPPPKPSKEQSVKKVCFCRRAILDPRRTPTTGLASWLECQAMMSDTGKMEGEVPQKHQALRGPTQSLEVPTVGPMWKEGLRAG